MYGALDKAPDGTLDAALDGCSTDRGAERNRDNVIFRSI